MGDYKNKSTNNRIIDIQEILFKEMKRLSSDKFLNDENYSKELSRSTALYNQATGFIKAINTQLSIMQIARRNELKEEVLIAKLGLDE